MNKLRKSISFLLAVTLTFFQPIVPLKAADVLNSDFDQIHAIGTRLLSDIKPEKTLYGLGDVDFNNLYIGESIPAYISQNTGFTKTDLKYYPILENGNWVATLTCYKISGVWNGQISTSFVSDLPSISANDNIALIFDNSNTYLLKNSAIQKIAGFETIEKRVKLSDSPAAISTLAVHKLVNKKHINIDSFTNNIQMYSNSTTQKYLCIPLIKQQESMSCSLASLESMCKHFGKNYTQSTLCNLYPVPGEVTLHSGATLFQLLHICSAASLTSTYTPISSFSFSLLKSNINSNKPMIAACTATAGSVGNSGHAVAIRGYTEYINSPTAIGSFAFMDPWDGTYRAGTVSNSNVYDFYILRENGSYSYQIQEVLAVGE